MKTVDVLIVGGGPTGLMMALELAVQNLSFRIVEKLPGRSDKTRALAVQPRTLEVLNRHGLAKDFIDHGNVHEYNHILWKGKSMYKVKFRNVAKEDTEFRSPLFISQADTEHLLDVALQSHEHVVERPVTVESIEQDDQGVTVLCSNVINDTKEEIRCKYVVGCDGAHSIVRRAANISFEGAPFPQDFILIEATCKWDLPRNEFSSFLGGQGILIVFPLKGDRIRAVASRPEQQRKGGDPPLAEFQQIFDNVVGPGKAKLSDPTWLTCFRYHHRFVDRYSSGRLFIAGDAAHVHSPSGGQGMNTGMQDSVNLGWKLGRVLRGEKTVSLLDTYDTERRPVGERLVKRSEKRLNIMTSTNSVVSSLRNMLLPLLLPTILDRLMGTQERRMKQFRQSVQLDIRYRWSPLVGTSAAYKGPLFGGDRAPDGDLYTGEGQLSRLHGLLTGLGHHLFLFSGAQGNAISEAVLLRTAEDFLNRNSSWITSHCIVSSAKDKSAHVDSKGILHKRFGFQSPGYVLVRPDGYIAYIGLLTEITDLILFVKK